MKGLTTRIEKAVDIEKEGDNENAIDEKEPESAHFNTDNAGKELSYY